MNNSLVSRHNGHRNDRRRAAFLQRAAAASDAKNPRHATTFSKKCSQSFVSITTISRPDVGSRPVVASDRRGAPNRSIPSSSRSAKHSRANHGDERTVNPLALRLQLKCLGTKVFLKMLLTTLCGLFCTSFKRSSSTTDFLTIESVEQRQVISHEAYFRFD